jgi:hypothetical protein
MLDAAACCTVYLICQTFFWNSRLLLERSNTQTRGRERNGTRCRQEWRNRIRQKHHVFIIPTRDGPQRRSTTEGFGRERLGPMVKIRERLFYSSHKRHYGIIRESLRHLRRTSKSLRRTDKANYLRNRRYNDGDSSAIQHKGLVVKRVACYKEDTCTLVQQSPSRLVLLCTPAMAIAVQKPEQEQKVHRKRGVGTAGNH